MYPYYLNKNLTELFYFEIKKPKKFIVFILATLLRKVTSRRIFILKGFIGTMYFTGIWCDLDMSADIPAGERVLWQLNLFRSR